MRKNQKHTWPLELISFVKHESLYSGKFYLHIVLFFLYSQRALSSSINIQTENIFIATILESVTTLYLWNSMVIITTKLISKGYHPFGSWHYLNFCLKTVWVTKM